MKFLSLLGLIFLSSCLLGPHYKPPEPCIPNEWHETACPDASPSDWWHLFCDPLLDKYIELAICHNNDLKAAEANILRAKAIRQSIASRLYPQVIADFNASRTYFSKNGPLFAASSFSQGINPSTGLPFQIQIPQIQNLFNALVDVSWEIDVFGKTRRSIEVAEAYTGYTIEQRNALLLTILSQVAQSYFDLRSYQKKGILIEENICLLEKNVEVTRLQFENGYRSQLDLERIEAELISSRSLLPDIYAQIVQNIYALSTLTGHLPETFMCELLPLQELPQLPCDIAMGLRSDLLRRRPDIRREERFLAGATASIGVAVASFFPTFTLSADVGFQSLNLSNLFQSQSKTWSIQGDVHTPIFQGGRLIANLKITEAITLNGIYTYQDTVLNAIKEAETSLSTYLQDLKTRQFLCEVVERNRHIVDIMTQRYIQGLSPLIDLLDAQRSLNSASQNFVESQKKAFEDLIILYKALGGGWEFSCP